MSAEAPILDDPPPPGTRAHRRWLLRVLLGLAVLVILACIAATWLFTTTSGARLVLSQVTRVAGGGIRYEGVQGSVGGPMKIKLIEVDRPDMYARVEDFEMDASLWAPLTGRLVVYRLEAGKVEVRTVSTGAAAQVPVSFAPPYVVRLERGHVGELRLGALTREAAAEKDPARKRALMDASAKTDLVVREIFLRGEGDQTVWKLDEASAATPYGKGKLAGTLQTRAPFALDAKLSADGVAAERPWRADIVAKGSLTAIDATLAGEVSGQPATGRVRVEPFATQPVRTLQLSARDVDLSKHAPGPRTRLGVELNLTADSKAFAGPVHIVNAEPGPWDRERLPFASANARVVITAERLDIHDLDVALAGGGTAAGRASLTRSGAQADLRVADVDLAALHGALQKTRVVGRVSVAGDRAAQRFDLALKDPRFEIVGRAALASQRLDVDTVTVRTGGGAVTAKGELALSGKRGFRFTGDARHFDPSAFVKTAKGDLNFTFVASGTASPGIAGEARLDIAPSTVAGLPVSGRVAIAGDKQRIASLDMDVAVGEGRASAKGSFGRAGDAMDIAFNAPNLSIIGKPLGVPLAGSLRGEGRLTGTFSSPAGRLAVNGANLALPSNVFVREIAANLEAGVEPSSPIDGTIRAKGVAIGEDKPPTPLAQEAMVTLKGTRAAHRLEIVTEMRRDTTVRAAFEGGLDPKTMAWNGRIAALAMTGRGAFALTQPATLSVAAERVELGDAKLKGEWGEARFMVTRWTPRTLEVKGSSAGIQVQNLARSLRLATVPRSNLVVAADWDVRAAEQLDATASLKRVSGDLRIGEPPLPLGLETLEAKLEVVRGRALGSVKLTGERVGRIAGEGTGLIGRGKGGWELVPTAPVSARVVAEHTNLEGLAPWLGPDAKVGGRLDATVQVDGTGADPRVSGTARAVDLLLREPQSGFELERGTLALRMTGKSVVIEKLEASAPWRPSDAARERMRGVEAPPEGGKLSASGSLDLGARTGAITVKVDKVPVTQVATRFLALSGDVRLEAGQKELLVTGALKADAGWIGALATALPSVSDDVVVVRAAQPAPADDEEAPREPIRLDLKLSAGDRLYFQGRGLDTRLAGDVHLTGTPTGGGLRATGTIRTAGGTYDGYGQTLDIERGVLTFQGALDNPRLNVLALRKGLPVEAGVEVLGTTSRPRVRLVSVPDVPEPEKLSWLVLGRGASDASLSDSALLLAAARALLGGNNPGSDMTKRMGFDEIKIGRADTGVLGVLPQSTVAGRTGTPSAADVVTVGRRLNRQFYLTYEQGLADAEGALKLAWRITSQFQVLARAGYLPGLDAVYRWSFL